MDHFSSKKPGPFFLIGAQLFIFLILVSCSSTPNRAIFPSGKSLALGADVGLTTAAWRSNAPVLPLLKFGIEFQIDKNVQTGVNFQYLDTAVYLEPFLAANSSILFSGKNETQVFISAPTLVGLRKDFQNRYDLSAGLTYIIVENNVLSRYFSLMYSSALRSNSEPKTIVSIPIQLTAGVNVVKDPNETYLEISEVGLLDYFNINSGYYLLK